jgi:protein TonB
VVAPRPDALAHNRPPGYPSDAVRRHAEGTVVLMVHVTEDGTPAWVDVRTSSGDASLDRSAKEAVALWRFQPARAGGKTVPFDYELAIHFSLDDRPGRPR